MSKPDPKALNQATSTALLIALAAMVVIGTVWTTVSLVMGQA